VDNLKDYIEKQNGEGGDAQDSNAGCMKVGCAVVAVLFFIFVLLVSSGDRKPDSNEDVKTEVELLMRQHEPKIGWWPKLGFQNIGRGIGCFLRKSLLIKVM